MGFRFWTNRSKTLLLSSSQIWTSLCLQEVFKPYSSSGYLLGFIILESTASTYINGSVFVWWKSFNIYTPILQRLYKIHFLFNFWRCFRLTVEAKLNVMKEAILSDKLFAYRRNLLSLIDFLRLSVALYQSVSVQSDRFCKTDCFHN